MEPGIELVMQAGSLTEDESKTLDILDNEKSIVSVVNL
jgi:hypothetical protein